MIAPDKEIPKKESMPCIMQGIFSRKKLNSKNTKWQQKIRKFTKKSREQCHNQQSLKSLEKTNKKIIVAIT